MFLSEICVNYFICKKLATLCDKFIQAVNDSYLFTI